MLRFAALAFLGLLTAGAVAQTFPAKPITVVVPFSAGGPTDTLARVLAERMRTALGQPVLVDNTTGAGGSIGVGKVVRAPADGYMLSIGHWGTHVVNGVYYTLPYNLQTDLDPVAMITTNPQLVISRNAVPATTLKELVAWTKANQDKVLMGTGGLGGASQMAAVYFGNLIGVKFQFVAYRGGAPALQGMLANEFDLYFPQVGSGITLVRAGRVRAYAVTSKNRQAAAPEIPSVDEAGLPGFHTAVWHGYWVPKGTPKDVVARLNAAIVESLTDPVVSKRFADLGQEIVPREQQTPAGLAQHHKAEIEKWWPIIRAAGLKAE
jgi:tripartite-type tricarboxylate transporter receptor subunit TctC